MNDRLRHPGVWLTLIGIAHLPFVVLYFTRLWNIEHYQFFPFALGAFAWLVNTRRIKGLLLWKPASSVCLAVDLCFLAGGVYLYSPWLVCVGGLFLCLSICLALQDFEFDSSLAYLALLPAITLRLPLQMDTQVIQWLQSVTTRVASVVLNHFGYLHLRAGNVLEFPGKRFMVEEACSGVQSLFTLLFLAALIACGYRRKWLHTILVLASAICFAGLMNVLRVSTVSMAWFSYGIDISTGWQHDMIGYVALVIAAMLVFSTDGFLNLVCSPVPDEPSIGRSGMFWNPLTTVWNWVFLVRNRMEEPSIETTSRHHPIVSMIAGVICVVSVAAQLLKV